MAERLKKKNRDIENLSNLFHQADVDGTGSITMEEFTALLDSPQVRTWLSVLELEVREVDGLFQLLDNGDGLISFEEFLSGVMRLRGGAKTVDLVTLLYENKKLAGQIRAINKSIENLTSAVMANAI